MILYEALSGRRPFEGEDFAAICYAIVHKAPTSIRTYQPGLTPAFDRFFARALTKDPDERFQDGGSFVEALHALRHEQVQFDTGATTLMMPGTPALRKDETADPEASGASMPVMWEAVIQRWKLIAPVSVVIVALSFAAGWGLRGERPDYARKPGSVRRPATAAPVPDTTPTEVPDALAFESLTSSPWDEFETSDADTPVPGDVETANQASSDPVKPKPAVRSKPASKPKRNVPSKKVAPAEPSPEPTDHASTAPAPAEDAGPVEIDTASVNETAEPDPTVSTPPPIAYLDVLVKSGIKKGSVALLMDGEEIYATGLTSEAGRLARTFRKTVGKASQVLEARIGIPPGPHALEVRVFNAAKSKEYTETLEVDLEPEEARTLSVVVGRTLGGRLSTNLE